MLPESSKVFVPMSLLALLAAVVYAFVGDDKAGVVLFVGLCLSAALATCVLLPPRKADAVVLAPTPAVRDALAPLPLGPGAWPVVVAIGATFLAVSFVYGWGWGVAGILILAAGGVGWLAQVAADLRGYSMDIGPLSIPLVGAAVIGTLMYFVSRILLALTANGAIAAATGVSAGILLVAILLALRADRLGSGALIAVLGLGAAATITAGIGALVAGTNPRGGEHHAGAEGANIAVVARNTQFDATKLDLEARTTEIMRFDNRDRGIFHNVAIYRDQNFTSAIFNGTPNDGGVIDYTTPALDPGTYYFHCDFHPTMQGTVDVK